MNINLFDYFEDVLGSADGPAPWAARAPRRPRTDYDLKLVPRSPDWQDDPTSLKALEQLAEEPWVDSVLRDREAVRLRLSDSWIETQGAALEAGGSAEMPLSDLAA